MQIFSASRNIKIDLLVKTIALLCFSITCIVSYSYYSGKNYATENASKLVQQFNSSLISETTEFISQARNMAQNGAEICSKKDLTLENNEFLVKFMLNVLATMRDINSLGFARDDEGILITIENIKEQRQKTTEFSDKLPENAIYQITYTQRPKEGGLVSEKIYCDKDYHIYLREKEAENIKNITDHEWYKIVSDSKKTTWSTVHSLSKSGAAGVTSAVPIMGKDGNIVGVFKVEISLAEISTFLNQMRISDNTHSFILDEQDKIVGDSDMSDDVIGGGKNLMGIQETSNKILIKALREFDENAKDRNKAGESILILDYEDASYVASLTKFPETLKLNWRAISVTPVTDFSEGILSIQENNVLIGLVILILAIIVVYFQTQRLSDPIVELAEEADKIKNFDLDDAICIESNIREIENLSDTMREMKVNLNNFSKYLPKALVTRFAESGQEVTLGGKTHNITILFTDIASFTTVSESIKPSELMLHLSDYFEVLTEIILKNKGIIDKFIGDAIMTFWGAPRPDDKQAYNACRAALLCFQKLRNMNVYWESIGKPPLVTRFGINSGPAVVGNVGSSERMNYTALGDNVNLAARLEGANKFYGTNIIISENVQTQIPEQFIIRPIDVVAVKGKNKGIKIFELVGLNNDRHLQPVSQEMMDYCKEFAVIFDLYISRMWSEAKKRLLELKKQKYADPRIQNDKLIEIYLERCEVFLKTPPPSDWDGVYHLTEK